MSLCRLFEFSDSANVDVNLHIKKVNEEVSSITLYCAKRGEPEPRTAYKVNANIDVSTFKMNQVLFNEVIAVLITEIKYKIWQGKR
jgi:hypothetical protein